MNGVVSFRNTRKYLSTCMSTDDGWTLASSNGSMAMRPAFSSARMVASDKITQCSSSPSEASAGRQSRRRRGSYPRRPCCLRPSPPDGTVRNCSTFVLALPKYACELARAGVASSIVRRTDREWGRGQDMAGFLDRLGQGAARHKWGTIGVWFLVAVGLVLGAGAPRGTTGRG